MILNGFLTRFKNKSFSFVRFGFLFFLFFNMLIFSNPSPGQRLRLVIGHYDCTSNSQCHENQYCDIDSHVCVDKNPEPACNEDLCDLEDICPVTEPPIVETCPLPDTCAADEYFAVSQKKCIKRTTNCNYILDDTCVECVTNADCAGKQCDSATHTCKDYTSCDPSSGKVLVDGKCACRGNMTENEFGVCTCVNMPEGGNSDTCDCDDDKVIVQGKCMPICDTSIPGITGERDAEGNCLCKTSAHYLEKAVMNADNTYYCECSGDDASGDLGYYKDPTGACMKCERTTKKWCYERAGIKVELDSNGNILPVDPETDAQLASRQDFWCDTIEEDKWKCPYSKMGENESGLGVGRQVWNPSLNDYCPSFAILKKNGNKFECTYCDAVNSRADLYNADYAVYKVSWNWRFCACAFSYKELSNGRCEKRCPTSYYYETGVCNACPKDTVYTKENGCAKVNRCANDIPYPAAGSSTFWWPQWKENTPDSCRANGEIRQTESGECSWEKGCNKISQSLVACAYNSNITSSCQCDGNTDGKLCCSKTAYVSSGKCVSCPAGEVVNAAKNGCEKCPANQISVEGKCQNCGENQYPNTAQTMCKQCKGGKVLNSGGTGCVCPSGTTEDPLTNTCA